jgi:hypothetical protein
VGTETILSAQCQRRSVLGIPSRRQHAPPYTLYELTPLRSSATLGEEAEVEVKVV